LHVLGIELLLHDLLERLEHQGFGVGDGKGLDRERSRTVS
jgi:hypothetical protein